MSNKESQGLKLWRVFLACLFTLVIGFSTGAFAEPGGSDPSPAAPSCGYDKFKEALGARESGGRYNIENSYGFLGKYQGGEAAMQDAGFYSGDGTSKNDWSGSWNGPLAQKYGIKSKEDFLNSPEAQEAFIDSYQQKQVSYIKNAGLDKYVGTQDMYGNTVTWSGLIGGAHLKGVGGLKDYLVNKNDNTDGYGTRISEYVNRFNNYDTPFGTNASGAKCDPSKPVNSSPRSDTYGNPACADSIKADVASQVQRKMAYWQTIRNNNFTPGPSMSQMANAPCMSKELQRLSYQFAGARSSAIRAPVSGLNMAAGPVSGIMNRLFKAEFDSINKAASTVPAYLKFQDMASSALGDMLSSMGLDDAFSGELCGLMIDMVMKYVQCEFPIKIPSLGNLFGSLNNLLPKGCAGDALRSTLFAAGNMRSLNVLNQPINTNGGTFSPGSATQWNNQMNKSLTPAEQAQVNEALKYSIGDMNKIIQ